MSIIVNWITPAGSIGTYPASVSMEYILLATAIGGTIVDYKLISGNLPSGINFRSDGKIYGTPTLIPEDTTYTFVVRVTATDGTDTVIQDRTFNITIDDDASPYFTISSGSLFTTEDNTWVEFPITYNNPISDNIVTITVSEGILPPGLEINEYGLIRGYANPPIIETSQNEVTSVVTATNSVNNYITVLSTFGLEINRRIVFSGTVFGNIVSGATYYIKEIIDSTNITITTIPNGSIFSVTTGTGFMNLTAPQVSADSPTKIQYNFTLSLSSSLGNDSQNYNIAVINQNLPVSQGGPGRVFGTRQPTIFNTRPTTYDIALDTVNYGYYVLPPDNTVSIPGTTYLPTQEAYMGQFLNDNFFAFHILGHDFDGLLLTYTFSTLPSWLTGDSTTGWLYGTPNIGSNTIQFLSFDVKVSKTIGSSVIETPWYNFNFKIASDITGNIVWLTDSDLGNFYNATICTQDIRAISDVALNYTIESGSLPPNLTLSTEGNIEGIISYQTENSYKELGTNTNYTFTVKASAQDTLLSSIIYATKTFSMNVIQEFIQPTDNLYITCSPNLNDRLIIDSLIDDNYLIPNEYIYRPNDSNFGKAKDVTYVHAYGIDSSNINQYLEAVQKNYYNKSVVLGELSTAIATDEQGNILYEVVYSNIIDDLMKYNSNYGVDYRYAISIQEEIYWPRFIDLNLGPWYTSSTDIFTSYVYAQDTYLITNYRKYILQTQNTIPLLLNQGTPTFYTSLTPGYARILYPNSLTNMRQRVEQELGFDDDFRKLPLWMTSQQRDGNTLGYTPAWVIAYVKPSPTIPIEATQTVSSLNAVILDDIEGISVGGKVVFLGSTFGNILSNTEYYVIDVGVTGYSNGIVLSETKDGLPITVFSETGSMTGSFYAGSYAEIIKDRIINDWQYKLNMINFRMDRFTVDKQITYNYDTYSNINAWNSYPSGTPVPDPTDSKNFYVLFPGKTILPNTTQYNL